MGLIVVLVVLLIFCLWPVAKYFVDENGLRRYPGPFLAPFSPLWQMWHNWRGQKFLAVQKAHEDFGDIVRLGPNHLSFSSPGAFKEIYGHGVSIVKDTFYDNQAGGNPSMADATSRELHRQKRRNLAYVFSPSQITRMEPRVRSVVEKLVRDIRVKSSGGMVSDSDRFDSRDGSFDLRPWLNMFSYDAITNVFWSQTYGFLDRGNDDCYSQREDGSLEKVHAMHTFHTNTAWSVFLGHLSPFWFEAVKNRLLGWSFASKSGPRFDGMARYLARQRIEHPPATPDLFSNFPIEASEKHDSPMSDNEILAESAVMLNAGNDTTQSALTNIMFEIASHPDKQSKLRDELRCHLEGNKATTISYETLQQVPYLRAVIDESIRLRPPLATGLPRKTTKATMIAGQMIRPGVTVSAQIWGLHRRPDLFHDPESWIPERWLAEEEASSKQELENLKNYVLPFSQGPRACIGRNLAYMELSVCIAALVLEFQWDLANPEAPQLRYHERFNLNPVELFVKATPLSEE